MNERIMEYVEQARQHATSVHPDFHDIKVWGKVYHEKFAELIIRECAYAVAQHNALSYQQSVPFNVSQVLNNHFGVE